MVVDGLFAPTPLLVSMTTPIMDAARINSERGRGQKFAYEITFKPFKNIFTDRRRVVGLCFET
jgi:hypothetical protein